MTTDAIPGFEARLGLFEIDDGACAVIARAWPLVGPHLDRAIDELIDAIAALPPIGTSSPRQRPSVSTEIQSRVLKWRTLKLSCRDISINTIAIVCPNCSAGNRLRVGRPDTEYCGDLRIQSRT